MQEIREHREVPAAVEPAAEEVLGQEQPVQALQGKVTMAVLEVLMQHQEAAEAVEPAQQEQQARQAETVEPVLQVQFQVYL